MTHTIEWPRTLLWTALVVLIALAWSRISPFDTLTWYLEIFPIAIVYPVMFATARRHPLTSMLYILIAFHSLILVLGAHYTYARVPLGFWFQDLLDLSRNNYDRLGHLAQGFIPAIAVREVYKRWSPVKDGAWLAFVTVATCLAISACYEFVEWWTAIAAGVAAEDFLATQGDIWDTQWDMFLALLGAIAAVVTLSGVHDRAILKLEAR